MVRRQVLPLYQLVQVCDDVGLCALAFQYPVGDIVINEPVDKVLNSC